MYSAKVIVFTQPPGGGGQYLLMRRNEQHKASIRRNTGGLWDLPGGEIEGKEDAITTALREMGEELHVPANLPLAKKDLRPIGVYFPEYEVPKYGRVRLTLNAFGLYVPAVYKDLIRLPQSGEVSGEAPPEHTQLLWVDGNTLAKMYQRREVMQLPWGMFMQAFEHAESRLPMEGDELRPRPFGSEGE